MLHAGTYLLKLQIDDVILHEWGQACPGMPKEAIETLRSQKLKLIFYMRLHIYYKFIS